MPHDKQGAKLHVGDAIRFIPINDKTRVEVGRILELTEGDTCSGRAVFISKYEGIKTDYFDARAALLIAGKASTTDKEEAE